MGRPGAHLLAELLQRVAGVTVTAEALRAATEGAQVALRDAISAVWVWAGSCGEYRRSIKLLGRECRA